MDSKIKSWIKIARKISKSLLNTSEDGLSDLNPEIIEDLKQPRQYSEYSVFKKRILEKYPYEDLIYDNGKKKKIGLVYFASAAVVLIAIGIGFYLNLFNKTEDTAVPFIGRYEKNEVLLVFESGEEVVLNNHLVLVENNNRILFNEENGESLFAKEYSVDSVIRLIVPRGEDYLITISDGTKIWVNSDSELRFPLNFIGDKREVYLKGEAYFDIAKDKTKPFYVNVGDIQVHATGTEFNISAYQDETCHKVTLIEGGVNIERNYQLVCELKPDMQFNLNTLTNEYKVEEVDVREATLWREGAFFFADDKLDDIVRKFTRWYDVNIKYATPDLKDFRFSGTIPKYDNITQILDIMKLTNEITYIISKNEITIYKLE